MKGQRVRREIKSRCDRAGRHPLRSGLDKQAGTHQAIILGESGQRRDGIRFFHISTIIELSRRRQAIFQQLSK